MLLQFWQASQTAASYYIHMIFLQPSRDLKPGKQKRMLFFFNHRWQFTEMLPPKAARFLLACVVAPLLGSTRDWSSRQCQCCTWPQGRHQKQTIFPVIWEGIYVKTYTPVLENDLFVHFFSKATTIIVREWFFSKKKKKKVLSTAMSSIKNQSFATILHRDQSNHLLPHEHRSQIPYSATSRNWNIPLWLCPTNMWHTPFYESNVSMKCLNQFQLYVVWMATGWSHGFVARRTVQEILKVQFHHSKCYLMISISTLVSIHFCLDFQASKNRTPKIEWLRPWHYGGRGSTWLPWLLRLECHRISL